MALKSDFFNEDRAVKTRLNRCQVSDADNIKLGEHGKHIAYIQEALRRLMPGLILPWTELTNPVMNSYGKYGPETSAAVAKYKREHDPQILNHRNAIDAIVGKKTITALDEGMYKLENHGRSKRGKKLPQF